MKNETNTKKISKWMIVMLLSLAVINCGSESGIEPSPDPDPNPSPEPGPGVQDIKALCKQACDNMYACGLQILDGQGMPITLLECANGCEETSDVAFTECLGEATCNGIEACFDLPAPEPQPDNPTSTSLQSLCVAACDNIYGCGMVFADQYGNDLTESQCVTVCIDMDDAPFAECLGENSCNNLNACFELPAPEPQPQDDGYDYDDDYNYQDVEDAVNDAGYSMPTYNW